MVRKMAKHPPNNEAPKNVIASSVEEARKAKKTRKPAPSVSGADGQPKPRQGRRFFANMMGNLFLGLVFLSLVAIPVLVYFTDTGARVKRDVGKILTAMGAGSARLETELKASRARIETLQTQVATLQSANASLAEKQKSLEEKARHAEEPPKKPRQAESASPAPEPAVPKELPRQEYELTRLFNGVDVRTTLDLQTGGSATTERLRPESYEFEMKLKLAVPKPHQSIAELAALNPRLPLLMPQLEKLLGSSKVSPLFEKLYNLKHERIKTFLTRLDRLETKHNYYDCETMLELTTSAPGGKALLVQGEMDVVADGSDGDRMPEISDYVSLSTYYQPTTSLAWNKRTATPNPLQTRMEKDLKEVEEEYAIKGLSPDRNEHLRNRRDELRRVIADMKSRSYLVAEVDPFIVLPLTSVLGQPGAPAIGDYAVVIHEGQAYPVLCGDAGPSWKFGEASLLVAKTLDDKASPYSRPVSDLKVTYLIFPGSADPEKGPPDLQHLRKRCQELLSGLGGLGEGYDLLDWRDHVAERRATREVAGLIDSARSKAAEAAGNAKEAAAQAAKKRKLAEEAGKRLQAAKTAAAAATPDKAGSESKAEPDAKSGSGTKAKTESGSKKEDGAKSETAAKSGTGTRTESATATSTAPAADLAKLQSEANAAESKAEEASGFAKSADEAAKQIPQLVKDVETAVAKLTDAVNKPYRTPKTETTDVALAALAEAKQAMAKIEAEVKKTSAK